MKRLLLTLAALGAAVPVAVLAQDIVLDEIVVTPNRDPVAANRTGVAVAVITGDDLRASGERSVAAYFRKLAGVTIRTTGPIGAPTTLLIRGASQNYLGAFVDGIDVTDPSGTQTAFDFGQMATTGISRIEVLKGSQSALHGAGAVGGVVSFTTARPEQDGLQQSVEAEAGSFNTQSLSYTATFRDDRNEAALTLGRIRTDGFSSASAQQGNTEADGFESDRVSFYLARTFGNGAKIGLNGFWEDSAAEYDPAFYIDGALLGGRAPSSALIPLGDGSSYDEVLSRRSIGLRAFGEVSTGAVDHTFGLSSFRIDRNFSENEAALNYSDYSNNGTPLDFSDDTYGTQIQTTDASYSGRRLKADWVAGFDLGAGRANLGAEWVREQLVQSGSFGAADNTTFRSSVFADYALSLGEQTDLSLSARVDRHSLFGNLGSARVALAHRLGTSTVLRFQAGTGFRAPSNFELYSFYGSTTLQPEKSTNVDVGIEHEFASGATLGVNAFRLEVSNLIDFDLAGTACPAAAVFGPGCYAQVAGRSVRSGFEVEGRVTVLGDLSAAGSYTYTDSSQNAASSWASVARHKAVLSLEKPIVANLTGRFEIMGEFDRPNWRDGTAAADYAVATAGVDYDFGNNTTGYLRVENLFDTQYELTRNYGTSRRAAYVGLRARF